jgi:hydroxymethylpyrimidine pyrophosphatase-like HAD family hydrolase
MRDKSISVIYASDLDRTIIFSDKFIRENNTKSAYTPVEYKGGKVISNISNAVQAELKLLNSKETLASSVEFIPVTSRSREEYERIDLGFKPKYAIIDNGGTILVNGQPMLVYDAYIQNMAEHSLQQSASILLDITEHDDILAKEPKLIDNLFLFWKIAEEKEKMGDVLINILNENYPEWDFTRQRRKVYGVPKCFSKQIALRWLWGQLGKPYLVVSGDGEMDLPMLTLANKALIPSHSDLLSEGFVESANIVNGGIDSPLETIEYVKAACQEIATASV